MNEMEQEQNGIRIHDVHDFFLCMYNKNYVGVFKRKVVLGKFYPSPSYKNPTENYYAIYIGIDTNYMSITTLSNDFKRLGESVITEEETYVVDCNMEEVISFGELRMMMHSSEPIKKFELGVANSQEILEVLDYAYTYYEIPFEKEKRKLKL